MTILKNTQAYETTTPDSELVHGIKNGQAKPNIEETQALISPKQMSQTKLRLMKQTHPLANYVRGAKNGQASLT